MNIRSLRPGAWLPAAAFAAIAWVICLRLPDAFPPEEATISVDMAASSGRFVELRLNDLARPPIQQPIAPGVRQRYVFPVSDDVLLLRIDPTDEAGADVQIFSVAITDSTGARATYTPADLSAWGRHSLTTLSVGPAAFRFVANSDDPMLQAFPRLVLERRTSPLVRRAIQALRSRNVLFKVFMATWLAWIVVGAHRSARWAQLPITLIALAAVWWLIPVVAGLPLPPPAVARAVGRAAVVGESLQARQLAVVAAVLVTALVGVAAGFVTWRPRRREDLPPLADDLPAPARARWQHLWIVMACFVAVAAYLPDFKAAFHAIRVGEYQPQWDSDNILYWAYLTSRGYMPHRDYWYPYAGFFVFDWPAPTGPVLRAAFRALVPCLFALCFYRASGRRAGACAAALVLLFLGEHSDVFPDLSRYILCTIVLIGYLGIERSRSRWVGSYAPFWLACGLALFLEPAQLIYASLGIGLIVAWEALELRRVWRPEVAHLARAFLVPALLLGIHLGWLTYTEQLRGFLGFYLNLGDGAAYSAIPTNVASDARAPGTPEFFLLVAAPLLVGLGAFERVRRDGGAAAGNLFLGLGCITTLVLQKHLVRPFPGQLAYLPVLGVLSAMLLIRGRRTAAERLVIGGLIGATAAAFTANGALTGLSAGLLDAPRRLSGNWATLRDRALIDAVNREAYAEDRFARFGDELALAGRLRELNGGRAPETFVLSDRPVLYILLNTPPVYHATLYNASPIYEQRVVVDWLSSRQVPFVVFDPLRLTMEGFAKTTRAPLVFSRVVQDYVPVERLGRYEITRRRRPGEPLAFQYWRDQLGSSVFLGHLPRLSSLARHEECASVGSGCLELAEVTLTAAPAMPTPFSLPLKVATVPFDVQFEAVPGVTVYHINLERLWFWTAARAEARPARIAAQRIPPSMGARIVNRAVEGEVLY